MKNILTHRTWSGRVDGEDRSHRRWHQCVSLCDLDKLPDSEGNEPVWIGFASDEGVRRNKGRTGARNAPAYIRKACSNFPVHTENDFEIKDLGDVTCEQNDLETAQQTLIDVVVSVQKKGYSTIILGGGHEVSYPHYTGIRSAHPHKKIGIINFDAHFDLRELDSVVGPTSGTGFSQIAQNEKDFRYLVPGIQEMGNTRKLFRVANELGVWYVPASKFNTEGKQEVIQEIRTFLNECEMIYLTICMDVFASAFAPGVSAPANNGILPDHIFLEFLSIIQSSGKVVGFDIAEVNPELDIDERTSKLAASFIYHWISAGWGDRF